MNRTIILLVCVFAFSSNGAEPWRTWTNLSGKKMTAALIREANGKVVIKRNDGKIFTVMSDIFGAADQKYLAEYKLKQKKPKADEAQSPKGVWSTLYDNNDIKREILSNGVELESLQRRNVNGKSLSFLPNLERPYSGWAFKQWGNGQLQVAGRFENGMNQGVWMNWTIRGEKVYQVTYKDDVRHGDCIDMENGVAKKIVYVNGVKQ